MVRLAPSPKKLSPARFILNKDKQPENAIDDSEEDQRKPENRVKARKPKSNHKVEEFDPTPLVRIVGFTTGSRETPSSFSKFNRQKAPAQSTAGQLEWRLSTATDYDSMPVAAGGAVPKCENPAAASCN
ncbi:uncharacterized protein PpBr36_10913 [Pyricularia pennisetigena]|uniref:uncharacterized protein n=1 Tax=Pyricularia pennisetigena TaxID=1578925 RepID=UPI001150FE6D|nr:uncharacterized protein PpBr36_10913 [Pyricularia pennisetigena]TLS20726.1 hypothetical protein PpBr36_10913 [Pyricularia pennisetigena]